MTLRNLVAFIAILFAHSLFAQAPQGINYQAAIRDASGNVLANHSSSLRVNIRTGSANGNIAYSETHSTISNAYGLVNLVIGQGNATLGNFSTIDWGNNSYFSEIQIDLAGGSNFQTIGNQQLMSVPYALYAEKSGTALSAPAGPQGPIGPQGPQGTNGTDGPNWLTGTTAPSAAAGNLNDLYLNTTNGTYYRKTAANTWSAIGVLAGPTGATGPQGPVGPQGPQGAIWLTGSGAPSTSIGATNDMYLDTLSGTYYRRNASSWALQSVLTAPQGPQGPQGVQGPTSTSNCDIIKATDGRIVVYNNNTAYGYGITSLTSHAWDNINLSGTILGAAASDSSVVIYTTTNIYGFGPNSTGGSSWSTSTLSGNFIGAVEASGRIVIYTDTNAYGYGRSSIGGFNWSSTSISGTAVGAIGAGTTIVIYTTTRVYGYGSNAIGGSNWSSSAVSSAPVGAKGVH